MRLIVDAWNIFIAGYRASAVVSPAGQPIGGLLFVLKTIASTSDAVGATSVDVVWETNGSPRRRSILREYKRGSSPRARVNRPYGEGEAEGMDNMVWQIKELTELLGLSGCKLFNVPDTEADDVIGHLVRYKYRNEPVTILSGDSDYFQLLENFENSEPRVRVVNSKGVETNQSTLIAKQGIHPSNWALAKAVIGDTSDNISGILGIGFKTLAKVPGISEPDLQKEQLFLWAEREANERGSKTLKWIKSLTETHAPKVVDRNLRLINLFNLNNNQMQIFEQQFIAETGKWMDSVEWMRRLHRFGRLEMDLWNGLSCKGRRAT
jgi:hypothetical protein